MPNLPNAEFLAEYQVVTSGSGFVLLQNWTTIRITGADRHSFLHNMCTNEIRKLGVGEGCEAFFTDVKGKIVAHTFILVVQDEIILLAVPNQAEKIIGHLDRYVIREDVQLQDKSQQFAWLAVLGPQSSQTVNEALAVETAKLERSWQSMPCSLGEVADLVVKFDAVGSQGYLIRCQKDAVEKLIELLNNASASCISEPTWKALRIEANLPLFGIDFDNTNLPQEIDRNTQAISFNKGCYLGQETIARIDALGHVNKKVIALQIAGETVPDAGTVVTDAEKEAGSITSASWSPRLAAPIALAMVRRGSNKLGNKLESDFGEATVVPLLRTP